MKAKTFTSFKLPAGWVVRNTEKKKRERGREAERVWHLAAPSKSRYI